MNLLTMIIICMLVGFVFAAIVYVCEKFDLVCDVIVRLSAILEIFFLTGAVIFYALFLVAPSSGTIISFYEVTSEPVDEIEWSKLSYQKTSSGYDVFYNPLGDLGMIAKKLPIRESRPNEAYSCCTTYCVRKGWGCLYREDKESVLLLSPTDYETVIGWVQAQEQQKTESQKKDFYQLNEFGS